MYTVVKMESALNGREQFMYGSGRLTEESNIFWDLEYRGYHGLQSVNDIPRLNLREGKFQNLHFLTETEVDHYFSLMDDVCPLLHDSTCFFLISMVLMLDTGNLIDNDVTPLDEFSASKSLIHPNEINAPTLSEALDDSQDCFYPVFSSNTLISKCKKQHDVFNKKTLTVEKRFREIKILQKNYINLLRNRCLHMTDKKLQCLGDTDQNLKRTISSLKQLAQYERRIMTSSNSLRVKTSQ